MTQPLLEVRNLHASVGGNAILRGIDLTVNPGEVHAVMGPNGSGKSTLAHVLAGRPGYTVTEGQVLYKGRDLLAMAPEMRAREGVFLAFQYPVEIPGVSTSYFLKAAVNATRAHMGMPPISNEIVFSYVGNGAPRIVTEPASAGGMGRRRGSGPQPSRIASPITSARPKVTKSR